MPKVKISEYSATANSNTDVASINIDEGCAPSGINNAIRAVMGHLKDFQQGTNGDPFNGPHNGTVGATTPAAGAFTTLSATGVTTVQAGTAAAPAITTTGDTNTGIFFPAADTIAFAEGGAEVARFDSSGNFGLGVTPSAWTNSRAIQFGNFGAVSQDIATSGGMNVSYNCYATGATTWFYRVNSFATRYAQEDGIHKWFSAASGTAGNAITFTQAMTLDASGRLLVGSTSITTATANKVIEVNGTGDSAFNVSVGGTNYGYLYSDTGAVTIGSRQSVPLVFNTANAERARITSGGDLLVGKTVSTFSTAGAVYATNGQAYLTVAGDDVLFVNRLTNDGKLIRFFQNSTEEGDISVSGTTVSYNGGHLSRWAQTTAPKDETLVKGTVLSNLDAMNVYTDAEGNPVANEQLNKVKVSDVEGDANVAGVFVNWSHDDAHDVDEINMAMTGDMIIRIAQGVTVARGDLLMSAGDGTAKPQGDDIVRSKTVAKVTSNHVTCTYADGSYCVPCVLMAC
jgi:hypothetical protein